MSTKRTLRSWLTIVALGTALGASTPAVASGDWINDTTKYPTVADQITALAAVAPGLGTVMIEVALRMNSLRLAGAAKNWGLASYQLKEMGEILEVGATTRPVFEPLIDGFMDGALADLQSAVDNQDRRAFKEMFDAAVVACNTCHTDTGHEFIVYRPSKSAIHFARPR